MLNTTITRHNPLLALAQSVVEVTQTLLAGHRPAPALVSMSRRRGSMASAPGQLIANGIAAHAAVCMQADPGTKGWRELNFGQTKTGDPRHFQPSRFAT